MENCHGSRFEMSPCPKKPARIFVRKNASNPRDLDVKLTYQCLGDVLRVGQQGSLNDHTFVAESNHTLMPSMGRTVYLATWMRVFLIVKYGLFLGKYTSPMDRMGYNDGWNVRFRGLSFARGINFRDCKPGSCGFRTCSVETGWFKTFPGGGFKYMFYFHLYLGKMNPFWLINIFQMGWFNHQLALIYKVSKVWDNFQPQDNGEKNWSLIWRWRITSLLKTNGKSPFLSFPSGFRRTIFI